MDFLGLSFYPAVGADPLFPFRTTQTTMGRSGATELIVILMFLIVAEVMNASGMSDRLIRFAAYQVLSIDAPLIYAATLAAIGDVQAAGSLGARELRLAQSDGLALDAGMLRAGTIRLQASDGVYIQNSGISADFAERRGFTANSLTIISGTGRPQIAINGRLATAGGLFATGLDTIPLVAIDGRYAAGSKINGCFIGGGASCTGISIDNRDTFNGLLDPSVSVTRIFPLTLIQLRDIVTQGYPPLIDEPVTGAGNEDLWEQRCGEPGEEACPAQ